MAAAERETLHFREYGFWGDDEGKTKEFEGLVMFINGGAKPSEKMWLREIWRDPIMVSAVFFYSFRAGGFYFL